MGQLSFPLNRIVSSSNQATHLDLGVDDLANDLPVGDPNDQPVLGRGVLLVSDQNSPPSHAHTTHLVLSLGNKSLSCVVVGLAFSSTTGLDLETREVGARLDDLVERHDGLVFFDG